MGLVYSKFLLWRNSGGAFNWVSDDIRAVGVNVTGSGTVYTPNGLTDEFLSDIPSGAQVFISTALSGKTISIDGDGNVPMDAADYSIGVLSGARVDDIVLVRYTGTPSTSRLIEIYDGTDISGLPYDPVGGPFDIVWPNDARKILMDGATL